MTQLSYRCELIAKRSDPAQMFDGGDVIMPSPMEEFVRKLRRFFNTHEIELELCLRPLASSDRFRFVGRALRKNSNATAPKEADTDVRAEEPEVASFGSYGGGGIGGHGTGTPHTSRSPNDHRSNAKNPNNPAHRAAVNNRSNQHNPNSRAYGASRGRK